MEAITFGVFQHAAAAAATFELRVRLLAGLATEGTPVYKAAVGTSLTPLVEAVTEYFHATDDDTRYLKSCAVIRNKLMHLALSSVTGRVESLLDQLAAEGFSKLDKGKVVGANLDTGKIAPVANTSTTSEGIYGWMLESALSGAFEAVIEVMHRATEIILRLRDERYKSLPQAPTAEPKSEESMALEMVLRKLRGARGMLETIDDKSALSDATGPTALGHLVSAITRLERRKSLLR